MSIPKVTIIDYGMGNIFSVVSAFEYLGAEVEIVSDPEEISKSSILGLTRHLATYWANKGIRVNTLTPGGVESGQNDVFKKKYSNRVPMNRMALPHEMAGGLLYLASDASSYVTGQNIIIDGGLSAW